MNKKTSVIALVLLIAAAVIFGFILVNKGDGPVARVIFSDKEMANVEAAKSSPESGVYLVIEKEFNKFADTFVADIPAEKDLYVNIHFVECGKGTEFTAKWLTQGNIVKEEVKKLSTNQQGVVSYLLEGNKVNSGSYTLEIYDEDRKLFKYVFPVK